MDSASNTVDIDDSGYYMVECLVERTAVATHTYEHPHFTQGQRVEAAVVGLTVTTKGYPNDAPLQTLKGIPCGIHAAPSSIIDKFHSIDASHVLQSELGLVETGETGA